MTHPSRIHLFQGYGIELEYMLVDKDTLAVKPVTDELLKHELGEYGSDFENGIVTWSNELVLHVVEIKSTAPESNFNALENAFAENVKRINAILDRWNAMLMPGAAHPFMDPLVETRLWPHDNNEVYQVYDKIFNSRGHGWSNLQSTHLNLPFYDDEEFAKLHAAVRIVLPILPALCASSPILDGKPTGMVDTRLKYYKANQARIPSITGKVIPEAIFSKRNYLNAIYEKIKADIAPFDPEKVLNPIWVNSRGAIPRFDRGSIEIRLMDIQECPTADMAIITLVTEVIKAFVGEMFIGLDEQMKIKTDLLAGLLDKCMVTSQQTEVAHPGLLAAFGAGSAPMTAIEVWKTAMDRLVKSGNSALGKWMPELSVILNEGTLSDRVLRTLGEDTSAEAIKGTYRKLCGCLEQDKMFIP
ncbi:MAG: glutamate-cysteine ligase family protein [Cyclobacteriaceae bacterium]|nr:glutamate--cysteine ligase [Cyclobacteriaceae bacterium]MCB9239023.1 glutamate--cysteine ligase [Flammeovirgaceae bacterium]MCB0498299.1 glutamate--cysteine ligase [Cyclobacteriaceae bacterium]MCO5270745.1 glutamate-cysteine ligase family protein [Cyclobacteriaceae bacterium]MCW5903517.1 glutamate--cysteine ligase [Cyclobacteriaceae bacterium]